MDNPTFNNDLQVILKNNEILMKNLIFTSEKLRNLIFAMCFKYK